MVIGFVPFIVYFLYIDCCPLQLIDILLLILTTAITNLIRICYTTTIYKRYLTFVFM